MIRQDRADDADRHTPRKGLWSDTEDQLLREAVKKYSASKWSLVAKEVPGRSAKSCRLRWCNQLRPSINKAPFSEWETAVVAVGQEALGWKWAELAKLLNNRTDNAVKNHWKGAISRNKSSMWNQNRHLSAKPDVTLEELLRIGAAQEEAGDSATDDAATPAPSSDFEHCWKGDEMMMRQQLQNFIGGGSFPDVAVIGSSDTHQMPRTASSLSDSHIYRVKPPESSELSMRPFSSSFSAALLGAAPLPAQRQNNSPAVTQQQRRHGARFEPTLLPGRCSDDLDELSHSFSGLPEAQCFSPVGPQHPPASRSSVSRTSSPEAASNRCHFDMPRNHSYASDPMPSDVFGLSLEELAMLFPPSM